MKLAGLGIIIVSACFWQGGSHLTSGQAMSIPWSGMGAVLVPCLLSYDGWNTVSFVAGEIRNPQKTFPLALAVGLGVVTLVYLAFNIATLHVLPVDTIASSERVGSTLAEMTLGKFGAGLVTFTILISVAGSLNSALMTPPRLYFAQARDGLFFRSFGLRPSGASDSPERPSCCRAFWARSLPWSEPSGT